MKFGNTDETNNAISNRHTALDYKSTYADVLKTIEKTGFSRIPIYQDSFDNQSICYIKDLLPHLNNRNSNGIN